MKEEICVFGEKAKNIQEGQIFKAVKYSVEGRDCVRLDPVIIIDKDGVPYPEVRYE